MCNLKGLSENQKLEAEGYLLLSCDDDEAAGKACEDTCDRLTGLLQARYVRCGATAEHLDAMERGMDEPTPAMQEGRPKLKWVPSKPQIMAWMIFFTAINAAASFGHGYHRIPGHPFHAGKVVSVAGVAAPFLAYLLLPERVVSAFI